jgi:hypothetical protein
MTKLTAILILVLVSAGGILINLYAPELFPDYLIIALGIGYLTGLKYSDDNPYDN